MEIELYIQKKVVERVFRELDVRSLKDAFVKYNNTSEDLKRKISSELEFLLGGDFQYVVNMGEPERALGYILTGEMRDGHYITSVYNQKHASTFQSDSENIRIEYEVIVIASPKCIISPDGVEHRIPKGSQRFYLHTLPPTAYSWSSVDETVPDFETLEANVVEYEILRRGFTFRVAHQKQNLIYLKGKEIAYGLRFLLNQGKMQKIIN